MINRFLICPGAQKSGTTWLFEQLKDHPEIATPGREGEELNFFYRSPRPGVYGDQFRPSGEDATVGLDVSPNYSAFFAVSQEIANTCPDAVIVFILRDPVERAVSQYRMATRLGNIDHEQTLIEAFRSDAQFMRRRGSYAEILREYDRFFPLGRQMLVKFFDDIVLCPVAFLNDVCDFTGISRHVDEHRARQVFNSGEGKNTDKIGAGNREEMAAYYEPLETDLVSLIGMPLPWSQRQSYEHVDFDQVLKGESGGAKVGHGSGGIRLLRAE